MNLSKATRSIALATALIAASSAGRATSGPIAIGVKERTNAYASLAASGEFAVLAWGATTKDGVMDIYVAVSRDGGRGFGAPARVNAVAGDARVSGEQPPRIALVPRAGRDPSIVVIWTAKGPAGTRLQSARSNDGGRSFAAPITVPGSEGPGNRGWESVAADRDGSVVTLWLDHRELSTGTAAAPMAHAEHQHKAADQKPADGVARAQRSKLFFARLGQGESARALTGGVCYCCKTAIATGPRGGIFAAWRHVYDGNVRDVAFTTSTDGGRTFAPPVRVSDDNWVLDGCPENGPALAVDDKQRIHVVWPTLVPASTATGEPAMALFYAMSRDGRQFTARQMIPTEGVPRHPQIVMESGGEIVVAWDEQTKDTRRISLTRATIDTRGTARFVRQRISDEAPAMYPVLAAVDGATIVAWTSGSAGQTVLRAARASK